MIHGIASAWGLQPIYLIWLVSLLSYVFLAGTLWKFCRGRIDMALLLSPMLLTGPIIGGYLVRKDVLALAFYGMSLMAIQAYKDKENSWAGCVLLVNVLSILAILSHESYGFWGLPSLLFIFSVLRSSSVRLSRGTIVRTTLFLAPSIMTFIICLGFKGSAQQALQIHQAWQRMANLIPSTGAIFANAPPIWRY
jgi:hypothetical protein